MTLNKPVDVTGFTADQVATLERMIENVYNQGTNVKHVDTEPTTTTVGQQELQFYDDGAGNKGVYCVSAKGNLIDLKASGDVIPTGVILMWSGSIATIPTGWALCDGNNGTPNLTNRFVVCADADSGGTAMSTVTGSALQTSNGQVIAHNHKSCGEDPGIPNTYGNDGSSSHRGLGGGDNNNSLWYTETVGGTYNVAVFYALAYIMKL
jgi:hypothetical protein